MIARKRDRHVLSDGEIEAFIEGVVSGRFSDAQVGSMLMAMFIQGLNEAETVALTRAMRDSGECLDFPGWDRPLLDKHSTGGVGDKVSLILAPMAAACGLAVPMISGRGLGHTGGTLDKLESIPGLRTGFSLEEFRRIVAETGAIIAAQSENLVPADRRLYAIRDVSGTVESIPLIVASILSKKLAAGLDGLVLDVKFGRGAFFQDIEDSRKLASMLVQVSKDLGTPARAVLSSMDQPLGRTVGNALEVGESIECLRGQGPEDLTALCVCLCAEMLIEGRLEEDLTEAKARASNSLDSGGALDVFTSMISAQGGDARIVEQFDRWMPQAESKELTCQVSNGGWVKSVDARVVGEIACGLGAGRMSESDVIDPAVGISGLVKIGERVEKGQTLARVHFRKSDDFARAISHLGDAIRIGDQPPEVGNLIRETI